MGPIASASLCGLLEPCQFMPANGIPSQLDGVVVDNNSLVSSAVTMDGSRNDDSGTNVELEVLEKTPLLEWFAEEYNKFGCTLEFVMNRSQEGSQFCRGFGGIGGILR
ncbi:eukaryotic release factor 1 [Artemisia annua]|uniref:Eukaryotic release factor 1 n=1 Tax=Artemisia annua TaxID=35608 RepID=A0A2U1MGR1_ARTAN|nr:eukaryotic release factor 1 [Artemisia annua]